MWALLNDPVKMQWFLVRAWHVFLLVGSIYVSVTPKFAWATPIFMILASTSTSPFRGVILGMGTPRTPMPTNDEVRTGRLPCHMAGEPCGPPWGTEGCPFKRAEAAAAAKKA